MKVVNYCFPKTWPEDREQHPIIGDWLQTEPAPLHVQKILFEFCGGLHGGLPRTIFRVPVARADLLT
jgi:hypothetical protein